jgi:hypothetical protein
MDTSPVRKITIMKELKMENQWICKEKCVKGLMRIEKRV